MSDCTTSIERFGTMLVVHSKEGPMNAQTPPKRPPFRRVVVFTGRTNG
jgi:hypothetical protein